MIGCITLWEEMQRYFLEKYFPASRVWKYKKRNLWNKANEWGILA